MKDLNKYDEYVFNVSRLFFLSPLLGFLIANMGTYLGLHLKYPYLFPSSVLLIPIWYGIFIMMRTNDIEWEDILRNSFSASSRFLIFAVMMYLFFNALVLAVTSNIVGFIFDINLMNLHWYF